MHLCNNQKILTPFLSIVIEILWIIWGVVDIVIMVIVLGEVVEENCESYAAAMNCRRRRRPIPLDLPVVKSVLKHTMKSSSFTI